MCEPLACRKFNAIAILNYVRQKARTQGHVLNNYIIDQGVLTSLDLNILSS